MTDPWDEKPELVWVPRSYYSESKIKEDDIQMILIDHAWLEKLKEEWDAILQHHITQEKGMQKEIDALKEKAERWDQYAIYDNDNEPKILVKDLLIAYETLEAVKTWVEKLPQYGEGGLEELEKILERK